MVGTYAAKPALARAPVAPSSGLPRRFRRDRPELDLEGPAAGSARRLPPVVRFIPVRFENALCPVAQLPELPPGWREVIEWRSLTGKIRGDVGTGATPCWWRWLASWPRWGVSFRPSTAVASPSGETTYPLI
jgi:hypothetical protein